MGLLQSSKKELMKMKAVQFAMWIMKRLLSCGSCPAPTPFTKNASTLGFSSRTIHARSAGPRPICGPPLPSILHDSFSLKFVKTPFPCIWSNRDMSLFSCWPISPQFCIVKSTKASEKWSHMGEELGGPLFHALGIVFRLSWGIFVNFLQ